MIVVFPAPLGPSRPTISPSAMLNETSRRASMRPYDLVKLETSIINISSSENSLAVVSRVVISSQLSA